MTKYEGTLGNFCNLYQKCSGVTVKSTFKRPFILFFAAILIVIGQFSFSEPVPNSAAPADSSVEADAVERQLRIYRETLQQGSSEDIRIDAAVGLLLQNTNESRDVLLSVLKSEENPLARRAVCKALIKSRGLSQTIDSLEYFRDPLLNILQSTPQDQAELASEAMLLFDYSDIGDSLMQIIHNPDLSSEVRVNGVYALQLRPEPAALRGLIGLLDDPDADVAKAAETALQESFGIPVGTSRAVWSDILIELQQKSPEEIRRERLLRQEVKLRQVQAERDRWQKLYLSLMDRYYETQDEVNQSKMLLEMLTSEFPHVRLWALERVSKYPDISDEFRDKIFMLLSDSSRDVRLRTANVLKNMSPLNPAKVLLERFQMEKDPEVALAMFDALGEACYYAFSPGSPVELSSETKDKTLEIAAGYLESSSAESVIKGGEVIRKILELNNLSTESIYSYLKALSERYEKSISETGTLRANLLSILAHLCGQGGAKAEACILYEPYFTEGLKVQDNSALRLAAAQGLSYVDKVKALNLFKQNALMSDESLAVQQVMIDLAGQTGDASDLPWLLELLSVNGHSDHVWAALKSICQRQKAEFLVKWLPTLEASERVTAENIREILDIAEQKAAVEKNENLLTQIQQQILVRLVERQAWDSALTYLEKIGYNPSSTHFLPLMNAVVLETYLYSGTTDQAVLVLQEELKKGDLKEANPLCGVLKAYFSDETVDNESKSNLLRKIESISSVDHPSLSALIKRLSGPLNKVSPEKLPSDKDDGDAVGPETKSPSAE